MFFSFNCGRLYDFYEINNRKKKKSISISLDFSFLRSFSFQNSLFLIFVFKKLSTYFFFLLVGFFFHSFNQIRPCDRDTDDKIFDSCLLTRVRSIIRSVFSDLSLMTAICIPVNQSVHSPIFQALSEIQSLNISIISHVITVFSLLFLTQHFGRFTRWPSGNYLKS